MIDIHDFKNYWNNEIAKGKYQGIRLKEDKTNTWSLQILKIETENNTGDYLIGDWGTFCGNHIERDLLIEKGVISDYTEYEENKVLERKYYDDLIAYILDILLENVLSEYLEAKQKYEEISMVINTSKLD